MGASNLVKPEIWSIAQLVENIDEEKIILPRYQRAQVWSKSKQKTLIQSIMSGFPIGSLLVYKNSNDTWQLIDGLQRATAIYKYHNKPLDYIDLKKLIDESDSLRKSYKEVCKKAYELSLIKSEDDDEDLNKAISTWLPDVDISSSSKFTPLLLSKEIIRHFKEDMGMNIGNESFLILEMNDAIQDSGFLDRIKDEVNLDGYSIPVVIYSGSKSNLPEIFEKVNVEGTKLSKYDVLAAVWYGESSRVSIDDTEIKDAIYHKYEHVQEDGFSVDDLDHDLDDYTLYEYLFGVGKYFADGTKYDILFKGGKDKTSVESFAFTICCIAHHLRLSDLEKLPSEIRLKQGLTENATIDLSGFFKALKDSVEFICNTLKPYIGIEFQKPFVAHTEYQICSYITRAMIGKYDNASWNEKPNWKADWSLLKVGIPQHYLYELMTNIWGNAGDTKLYNNVWAGAQPSDAYTQGYTEEEWRSAIKTWFNEDLRKRQKTRSSIDDVSKVFLKYIYGNIATATEEKGQFDIDHIYPIKLLATKCSASEDSDGWPMSAIGNLEFLQTDLNNKKKTQTLGDYYSGANNAPANMSNDDKKAILKRFSLCDDPSSVVAGPGWSESDFLEFVKNREKILEEKLLECFDGCFVDL